MPMLQKCFISTAYVLYTTVKKCCAFCIPEVANWVGIDVLCFGSEHKIKC